MSKHNKNNMYQVGHKSHLNTRRMKGRSIGKAIYRMKKLFPKTKII